MRKTTLNVVSATALLLAALGASAATSPAPNTTPAYTPSVQVQPDNVAASTNGKHPTGTVASHSGKPKDCKDARGKPIHCKTAKVH